MHLRFSPKIRLLGAPQSPGKGRLRCLANRSTCGAVMRPCGHCKTGDLTGWEKVCLSYLEASAERAAAPRGARESPLLAILFWGLGFGLQ